MLRKMQLRKVARPSGSKKTPPYPIVPWLLTMVQLMKVGVPETISTTPPSQALLLVKRQFTNKGVPSRTNTAPPPLVSKGLDAPCPLLRKVQLMNSGEPV